MTARWVLYVLMMTVAILDFRATVNASERGHVPSFVATPQEVVTEMLKAARVTRNDRVYDLGCGDGRLVITAAKLYGARGVGVDIDPVRIKESKENAVKAAVADRVTFLQQDLFELEFSQATVVTLYLLMEMNLRLRPRLLRDLRPGSRVVSHEFGMGDWKPDQTRVVRNVKIYYQSDLPDVKDTYIHLWTIPAPVAGDWEWSLPGPGGRRDYSMSLVQKFQQVSGTVNGGGQKTAIENARLSGAGLSFTVKEEIGAAKVVSGYHGKVEGRLIVGSVEVQGGPLAGKHSWQARPSF